MLNEAPQIMAKYIAVKELQIKCLFGDGYVYLVRESIKAALEI